MCEHGLGICYCDGSSKPINGRRAQAARARELGEARAAWLEALGVVEELEARLVAAKKDVGAKKARLDKLDPPPGCSECGTVGCVTIHRPGGGEI